MGRAQIEASRRFHNILGPSTTLHYLSHCPSSPQSSYLMQPVAVSYSGVADNDGNENMTICGTKTSLHCPSHVLATLLGPMPLG